MNVGIATNPNEKDPKTLSKGMVVLDKLEIPERYYLNMDTWRLQGREYRAFFIGIACPLLFIQGETDEYGILAQVEKTIN